MNNADSHGLVITTTKPITHPSLIHYIDSRAILAEFYRSYCKEIHYQVGDRKYFAIGFPNDRGGWELRSDYFKGCSSPNGRFTNSRERPGNETDTTINQSTQLAPAIPLLKSPRSPKVEWWAQWRITLISL